VVGGTLVVALARKTNRVRRVMAYLLFSAGFLMAPFVGVSILLIRDALLSDRGYAGVIFGGSVVTYLLLYMGLWLWLKKQHPTVNFLSR